MQSSCNFSGLRGLHIIIYNNYFDGKYSDSLSLFPFIIIIIMHLVI